MEVSLEAFKRVCQCGYEHPLTIEKILIGPNLLEQVEMFLQEKQLMNHPIVISDDNTYPIFDRSVLKSAQFIILNPKHLHADESGLAKIRNQLGEVSVFIAFGSGTIHDLSRYLAYERDIPFISVPTAASVDGFASTVAAMTFNGFKVTVPAQGPLAIFADSLILAKAPAHLTAAGVGDLLAKYTALLDWKVSHLLTGETICYRIVKITEEALQLMLSSLNELAKQKPVAYEPLIYGLILSGIGMQMIGSSRPASGAEHHLSHLWEMQVINEELSALHGEKVGVGLLQVCEVYRSLLKFQKAPILKREALNRDFIQTTFGPLADAVVQENKEDPLLMVSQEAFEAKFKEIQALVAPLPTPEQLKQYLEIVGGKTSLEAIGLDPSLMKISLQLAPYVRNRLTLLKVINRLKP